MKVNLITFVYIGSEGYNEEYESDEEYEVEVDNRWIKDDIDDFIDNRWEHFKKIPILEVRDMNDKLLFEIDRRHLICQD